MSTLLSFILDHGEQFKRARLGSLYSDFRPQRSTNPDGYAANVAAWEDILCQASRAGLIPGPSDARDRLCLRTGEELSRALETKEWGRPLALGAVIDEAVSHGRMIPRQLFLDSTRSIYERSKSFSPGSLISWILRPLGLDSKAASLDSLSVGHYVLLRNVEVQQAGDSISSRLVDRGNRVDRILSTAMFQEEAAAALSLQDSLTDADLRVLLTHLARDRKVLVHDGSTIKFKGPGETVLKLTDQDKTIASLKTLISKLNLQITSLEARVHSLAEKAQKAVSLKNRVSALAALRSKRMAESSLTQRSQVLTQLEEIYAKIEQAADQVDLVRVMEASSGVLQGLHAEIGGVERVEDVVEELKDNMRKVDEIGDLLQGAGSNQVLFNDSTIDEEMEALFRQKKLEDEEREAQDVKRRLTSIEGSARTKTVLPDKSPLSMQRQEASQAKTSAEGFENSFLVDSIQALDRISLDGKSAPVRDQIPLDNSTHEVPTKSAMAE